VKVHEKSLTLPGATVCSIGTTEKLFESGSSEPSSMLKKDIIVSKNVLSAALVVVVKSVNSRPAMSTAGANRLQIAANLSAE